MRFQTVPEFLLQQGLSLASSIVLAPCHSLFQSLPNTQELLSA